jgi:hypothetical protein
LSRIQLLTTRLFVPPAPAYASAPSSTASSIWPPLKLPKLVTVLSTSPNACALTAVVSATTRNTSTIATLPNSSFSIVR